jgi:TonB family protein
MKSLYVALVALCGCAASLQAQGFQVVVHESNSADRISAGDLARIYLREQTTWSNGSAVVPVDLPESSARERFSNVVLGKSTSQIKAHWQREVFAGRAVPPAEEHSEREVLAFVAANPGSVGYVSEGATLPSGVRSLPIGGASGDRSSTVYMAGQVEKAPQLISQPYVNYPSQLLSRGTEGQVILQFVVNQQGRVDGTSISVVQSSARAFEAPAIEAVRRSAFKAGRVAGRAVPVQVRQTVMFSLADRG